jgi:hypothetical protein
VIGEADTKSVRPLAPVWVDAYAKGCSGEVEISCRATGFSEIVEDFASVDDWWMVYGQLMVADGNVYGPIIGYAAGIHKTQLLTDNCRAKITLQSGTVASGESRVVICADERMNSYYGMALVKDLSGQKVAVIRGSSSISVEYYNWTPAFLTAGSEFEVWYDRRNSVVRIYQDGSELCSKSFSPTDIPHGPGCRWTGVVMSARLLDAGPRFDTFEATDIQYSEPVIHDAVADVNTPNPGWVPVLGGLDVHPHIFVEPSLGPDNVLYTSAAARWTTPVNTNSVRAVFSVYRNLTAGKFRLAVRSNSAMTNWVGVQFDGFSSQIHIVTGSGPDTVTLRQSAYNWVSTWQKWWVTWNDTTKTLKVYKSGRTTPVLSWPAGSAFTGTGKYVGLSWTTGLFTVGTELTALDVYDVTADDPID